MQTSGAAGAGYARLALAAASGALVALMIAAMAGVADAAGGAPSPRSFGHGFDLAARHALFGLGHLGFLAGAGVGAVIAGARWWGPLAFTLNAVLGAALVMTGRVGPADVTLVAATVALLGLLLIYPRPLPLGAWLSAFGLAGLVHGSAFGALAVGVAGPPVLGFYLSIALFQTGLAIALALALGVKDGNVKSMRARLLGAALAGFGAAAVFKDLGLAFAAGS